MVRIGLLSLALLAAACSAPAPAAPRTPAPTNSPATNPVVAGVSTACATAFATAAALSLPKEQDLIRIVKDCPTAAEVAAANKAIPGALEGQDVAPFLKTYCDAYLELKESAVCKALR